MMCLNLKYVLRPRRSAPPPEGVGAQCFLSDPGTHRPIPSYNPLSSAHDARGARTAHGCAFRSRRIRPRKNLQQKHSTIPTNNTETPNATGDKRQSRAACERSPAGEARFLWFFLFRKKKERSPHVPARRASTRMWNMRTNGPEGARAPLRLR